jgi:hypothetical protein
MVVAIVLIVTIGSVLKARWGVGHDENGRSINIRDDRTAEENQRLRGEIGNLKERIAVLERVITDNNSSSNLDREIEKLRDRDG